MFNQHDFTVNDASAGQNEPASTSKRRRIALACRDCRRRKLGCDRSYPACGRCQKSGCATSCTYDPDALEAVSSSSVEKMPINPSVISTEAGNKFTPINGLVHHRAPYQSDTGDGPSNTMQLQITRLENRITGLEKTINSVAKVAQSRPDVATSSEGVDASKQTKAHGTEFLSFGGKELQGLVLRRQSPHELPLPSKLGVVRSRFTATEDWTDDPSYQD